LLKRTGKLLILAAFLAAICSFAQPWQIDNSQVTGYVVDLKKNSLQLYWKDDKGQPLKSISNLKTMLGSTGWKLVFAMNGGMYKTDNSPLGLFVQNGKDITKLNTKTGEGNFYMQPNGVFLISKAGGASICKTSQYPTVKNVQFATQSGPMLVIDGKINSLFKEGSANLNVRNGVGILPDGKAIFAISKEPINFYDFAAYFQQQGCKNALYLDGFVSRMYLPEKSWEQTDGNFGVIIGVAKPKL
jgi:uncharacterized protein YigE (DUF2233 family)